MKQVIEAWEKYGVVIEQDKGNYYTWAERFEDGTEGVFSPPFSTLQMCISDLEDCFGPLEDQKRSIS